ncbi:DNA gyrase subunit A [Candidatus Nomurabacteria bacterium RIFCSPLOWO2_01_FULL_41_21]|uniref:DNA gyrase subunit A n=2 Tax=Candidatus Nomuraibacteriota TaxID=1752729 RepID=A0A1F6V2S1_9BACT|nr:MAG: DNA gyrase subunit A [Candidatus Nomurabacteria bacterium RIFCSPHIGHO2_01_FULL_40_20]OGI88763.1 MAG: DNA gyrase subunit A [Candidatus Nomurabacteria bacterium RIFCSPLOWO2_01_FULL_41_21]
MEEKINKDEIIAVDIISEMKESYLAYAMSVITARALPDVRDGLKPVHRRILYAMHEMGLTSSARFRKSAAVVGDVLGKYHPHGDVAVYDSMVGMAQEFSYRYPLILGQGNFGSIDGDNAAAMRYTEAKMSKISSELLRDMEKETVDFRPNYDQTRKEPVVFPSAVPSLLLNGTLGIAVGMATNIPSHNLGEVVDATNHLIENPEATTEDLMQYILGPDFPTGGIAYGHKDMLHAYSSGRGGVVCRGEAEIVEGKGGSFQIIITSIPFRVNKANLIMAIAELVQEKKLDGIKGLRDESTKDIRIVIDLKNGATPEKVLNYIYKNTQLEQNFNFNLVALVDGVPETLSLKSILSSFIAHRQIVVKKRSEYDLRKAEEREHILLGLKKALDKIDRVITVIRASKDASVAKVNLMKEFKFSDLQASAILEMKLQKLAGLERKAVEQELKERQDFIKEIKELLASPKKILKTISSELSEIKEKYKDERRTKIVKGGVKEISDEDLIPEKETMLVFTAGGYVKRTDPGEYKSQKRGGVGVVDLETKEEDFVTMLVSGSTHNDLLFFTNLGKAYSIKMYDIPEGRRATRGKSVMNFLSLSSEEKVTSVLPMPKALKNSTVSLMLMTKGGTAKKMAGESFKDVRRSGIIAIKLDKNDQLISALLTERSDEVMVATSAGQSIRFKESDIREMGRTAGGVRGIKLGKGDEVISVDVIKGEKRDGFFLSMSAHGFGKKTSLREYKVQKRGGSGIKTAKITSKTGKLIVAKVLGGGEEELIAMSKKGQVIRTTLKDIATSGRQTQGVTIMRLRAGDGIASIVCM